MDAKSQDNTPPIFLAIGSCSAALAVIAGAFGAHALKGSIDSDMLSAFETAVRYQMYHAFGLVAIALTGHRSGGTNAKKLRAAGFFFILGTVLFPGSLYIMALTGTRWLGAVTPVGGISFILGWLLFARFGRTWTRAESIEPRA